MWIDLSNHNKQNKKPEIWKLSLTTYILTAIFSEKLS